MTGTVICFRYKLSQFTYNNLLLRRFVLMMMMMMPDRSTNTENVYLGSKLSDSHCSIEDYCCNHFSWFNRNRLTHGSKYIYEYK